MAKTVDISQYLGNNKKNIIAAAVGTVKIAALKETGVASGDKIVLTKIPANSLITGVTLVVKEGATGGNVNLDVNGASVAFDMGTAGVTAQASWVPTVTKDLVEVTGDVTMGASKVGEGCVVIHFVELEGYTGTFVG
mgnify:FL=1|jgi:hypothetical protein|nr:MAG TPA: hypothetical protein [Caudoviricetes sp.]